LLGNSRSRTKVLNKRGRNIKYDITLDDIIEIYKIQKGRCFYSNVPLEKRGHFGASLERLNTTKGYVKDNVVLIIAMMNSIDLGHTSWSREKFALAKNFFLVNEVTKSSSVP
jgi:hypothetical protein